MIEAVAALRPRHPGLRLLVGGGGPDRERLRRLAESVGLSPEAVFVGRLSEGQKSACSKPPTCSPCPCGVTATR